MYLVLVHLKSSISTVSAWTIEVYIVLTSVPHTITLSHLNFWSGWTSGAHLMHPVLSYQVVFQDHVYLLPLNMTALMVSILRVEERGNVLLKQLPLIAGLSYQSFRTGSRHAQVQGTIRQQAKMCFPE